MLCHLLRLPRARVAGVGVGLLAPSPSSFFQEEGEEALAWAERETCVLPTLFLSLPLLGVGTMLFFPALSSIQAKGGDFFPKVFLALRVWLTLHNFCATWLPPFWLSQKGREPFLFGLFHRVWLTLHNFAGTLFPLSEFNLDRGKRVPFLFQKFNIEGLAHIAQLWTTYHPMRSRSQTPKHEHSHTHT